MAERTLEATAPGAQTHGMPRNGAPMRTWLHWRAWLLLAIPALLPFGRLGELPLLIGAIVAIVDAVRTPFALTVGRRVALCLFAAYWLPELVSAFDSIAPGKSWLEVGADLRYLPFLLFACSACRAPRDAARIVTGLAALVAFWCLDALVQARTGWSLGGAGTVDRLSGIFGDDNLKLGGAVAVLAPFALWWAWRRWRMRGLILAFVPLLVVVLLAGARAAWLMLAIGFALVAWRTLGAKRALFAGALALLVAAVAGSAAYALSSRFEARVERTFAALSADDAGIDHALSGRMEIWRVATRMGRAHPFNGVGVRAFRYAYPQYASPHDPFVEPNPDEGAMHAHQLVLEVWSETGTLGLLAWLAGAWLAWRAWRNAQPCARARAAPAAYALVAMLFPLNTHYAAYSSFWGLLLMGMLALWLALLAAPDQNP